MKFGKGAQSAQSALQAAQDPRNDPHSDGAVNKLVATLLAAGLDGVGPMDGAAGFAERARSATGGNVDRAIERVVGRSTIGSGVGGFVTGLGGFVTMPVAMPANIVEFYVLATRMVGAIAHLRGYDVTDRAIRTAVLLTLVGADSDDVLKKAGLTATTGKVASLALRNSHPAVLMAVNKAIGFRLLRGLGERALSRLGRGVPLAGGVVGGGLDMWMLRKIANQARQEFPVRASGQQ